VLYGPEKEDLKAVAVLGEALDALAATAADPREADELMGRRRQLERMQDFRCWFYGLRQQLQGEPDREERIRQLEELAEAQTGEHFDWGAGHLWILAGKEAMAASRPAVAAECFTKAVECFTDYPAELRRRAARPRRALALAQQQAQAADPKAETPAVPEAELLRTLQDAEQAVTVEPLSAFERQVLGDTYEALGNLERARAAWSSALLWKPSDPTMHWKLGFCHWMLALEATDSSTRDVYLTRAEEFLSRAVRLYGNNRYQETRRAHYWLAKIADERDDFQSLAQHLRIVQESPKTRPIGDLLLAEGSFRQQRFVEAEDLFRRVLADTSAGGETSVLGDELGDRQLMPALRVRAACDLATSLVEREGSPEEATQVLKDVTQALRALEHEHPADARDAQAAFYACRGKILRRTGKLEPAFRELRRSISLGADAETYIELALTRIDKANVSADAPRAALLAEASTYRDLARATDRWGRSVKRLEELDAKLRTLGASVARSAYVAQETSARSSSAGAGRTRRRPREPGSSDM
jgi:tetratricopeptide (TPR) repeat protein